MDGNWKFAMAGRDQPGPKELCETAGGTWTQLTAEHAELESMEIMLWTGAKLRPDGCMRCTYCLLWMSYLVFPPNTAK